MNRRQFLVQIAAIAAATAVPLQAVVSRGGDIAREVARFSQGGLRFFSYDIDPGMVKVARFGDRRGWLGWIENARGESIAWVDKAQRIWWPNADGTVDITRVFQR